MGGVSMNRLSKHQFAEYRRIANSRSVRVEKKRCIISGQKIIADLPPHINKLHYLYTNQPMDISVESTEISINQMQSITGLKEPDGHTLIIEIPQPVDKLDTTKHWVYLHRIQNPGNIGAIVRCAHAFSWGVISSHDSCDLFHTKSIRGSAGSVFHIPYQYCDLSDLSKISEPFECLTTGLAGSHIHAWNGDDRSKILIFCNEGAGWQYPFKVDMLTVPLNPTCDSLNVAVAAGIIMHHISEVDG